VRGGPSWSGSTCVAKRGDAERDRRGQQRHDVIPPDRLTLACPIRGECLSKQASASAADRPYRVERTARSFTAAHGVDGGVQRDGPVPRTGGLHQAASRSESGSTRPPRRMGQKGQRELNRAPPCHSVRSTRVGPRAGPSVGTREREPKTPTHDTRRIRWGVDPALPRPRGRSSLGYRGVDGG